MYGLTSNVPPQTGTDPQPRVNDPQRPPGATDNATTMPPPRQRVPTCYANEAMYGPLPGKSIPKHIWEKFVWEMEPEVREQFSLVSRGARELVGPLLHVSGNDADCFLAMLREHPERFSNLRTLVIENYSSNFTCEDLRKLPITLQHLTCDEIKEPELINRDSDGRFRPALGSIDDFEKTPEAALLALKSLKELSLATTDARLLVELAKHPTLERLSLDIWDDTDSVLSQLEKVPVNLPLKRLIISGLLKPEQVGSFSRFQSLKELEIGCCTMAAFVQVMTIPNLEKIFVTCADVVDYQVYGYIRGCDSDLEDANEVLAHRLAADPAHRLGESLENLKIYSCQHFKLVSEIVARARGLRQLEIVSGTAQPDRETEANLLGKAISGLPLNCLSLTGFKLNGVFSKTLGESKLLELSLGRCAISDNDLLHILAQLPGLVRLDLIGQNISGGLYNGLAQMKNLRMLGIDVDRPMTRADCEMLAKIDGLEKLYFHLLTVSSEITYSAAGLDYLLSQNKALRVGIREQHGKARFAFRLVPESDQVFAGNSASNSKKISDALLAKLQAEYPNRISMVSSSEFGL
ncbi:hypothetical protein ACOTEY_25930 [Achromobacter xylosoxidans]